MSYPVIIQRAPRDRQRGGRLGVLRRSVPPVFALCACVAPASVASRPVLTNGAYTPIRVGPTALHTRLTELPAGVPLWAEDKVGGWYRLRLSKGLTAYAHEVSVDVMPPGEPPPPAEVSHITVAPSARGVKVTLSLGRRVPYRVRQVVTRQQLCIDLFGARVRDCRWSCLPIEGFVGSMRLRQPEPDRTQLVIDLAPVQQRGYEVRYSGEASLVIEIRRPYVSGTLHDKVVALDPGHGGKDEGAVGAGGLQEKNANLAIALEVGALLVARGSRVVLTRDRDRAVAPAGSSKRTELTTRVLASKACRPDVFVSIHCNHPGGRRPDVAGTETYYWSPMSARPAHLIQRALCAEAGTLSRRVAPRPFRVLRETDAPRVLVECCYISCPQEEAALRDSRWRRRVATGIVNGLSDYFRTAAPRPGLRCSHGE